MSKWVNISLALVILAVFSLGCTPLYISKEEKIKCPKCGAIYTTEEGQKEMQKNPPQSK